LSLLSIPVMESSGQSGASKQTPIDKPAHIYEMFRASGDYSTFKAEVICPIICGTHQQSYIYPSKFLELPLPISYASPRCSVESINCLILETDHNCPSQDITFPHYIAPSLRAHLATLVSNSRNCKFRNFETEGSRNARWR
jgi:hypothetical protein